MRDFRAARLSAALTEAEERRADDAEDAAEVTPRPASIYLSLAIAVFGIIVVMGLVALAAGGR